MIIYNIKVNTMDTEGVIENGYVHIEKNKIVSVGSMDGAELSNFRMINGNGLEVYPGFIDIHTHLGIFEDGLTLEGDDGNESSEPVTPHLRALDAVNPNDRCFKDAVSAGITTVITGPGSSNPIAGQSLAMKTHGNRIDKMVLKAPIAIKFALGENPKTVYNEKNQMPYTRMATAALIREALEKAKQYMINKETSSDDEQPEYDMKSECLIPLLKREIQAHFHAHRADDIFTAIRIAKEFNLDYVIIHGTEGHLIVDELIEDNARVMSGPFLSDRSKPELLNLTPKTPAILSNKGVVMAIVTDHPVIPIQYLPLCASLAVREGMDKYEAMKAITIGAAKSCGLDNTIGSIKAGKDADLVFFEGDPLDIKNKPKMVICSGELILNIK